MRTFTRSDLDAANAAWTAGEFSREWRDIRHKAAMGGLIYPPDGDKHDSWEDDSPSQRAILIRAVRETPKLLDRCVVGASSWYVVIDRLTKARDEWRDELNAKERAAERERRSWRQTNREAMTPVSDVLPVVAASIGVRDSA
jgi:hypothetical protein